MRFARSRGRAALVAATLVLGSAAFSAPAFAQDVSAAANAFSRAQKAELGGDHEAAAELYELADSLAPAPEALRSALKARKAAGQLDAAAVHAEALLRRYPDDKRSKEMAEGTLAEAKGKFSRYAIHCQPKPCGLIIDGAAEGTEPEADHIVYMEPGKHNVIAVFGSAQTDAQSVESSAGEQASLSFEAPPESDRPREDEEGTGGGGSVGADEGASRHGKGLPPWLFVTSAAVTVALGGVSVWSGLDVLKAHDDYEGHETQQKYSEGRDKEKRTNVLIGATAGAAVITGVLAILTDWGGKRSRTSTVPARHFQAAPRWVPGGGLMNVEGRF